MAVLAWRPRTARLVHHQTPAASFRLAGSYAGRARFRPRDRDRLPEDLRRAVGRVVEFGFAGVAPRDEPFGGQSLYLEWCSDDVFGGFVIPEQDLEFLKESPDPMG